MFSPLIWIVILLAAGFLLKNKAWKRVCFGLGLVVFLIFSNPALYNSFAGWWQPKPVHLSASPQHKVSRPGHDASEASHGASQPCHGACLHAPFPSVTNRHGARLPAPYSFGIVAGGFGSVDKEGNGYFNSASDRFLQTVKLYKTGVIDHILISGGNSRDKDKGFREANWAKQEMIQFGVPDTVIFVEDKSANTAENAKNSKRMLDSLGAHQPYVLITSAFHMPRAKKLYERAGLEMIPFPCNYTEGRGPVKAWDFVPSVSTVTAWPKYIKEVAWMLVRG